MNISAAKLQDLVTLFPFGLGSSATTCFIFSGDDNVGDGVADCTATDASKVAMPPGYSLRSVVK